MKLKNIIYLSLAVIFLFLVIGICYIYYLLQASLPKTEGNMQLSGLTAPVEITFDKMGIAQIWAATERDAWFAVGWLQAGDRLFQMDLTRRVATGRLSEMFGVSTLEIDRLQRKIGHGRLAKQAMLRLDPVSLLFLKAYIAGINSWIASTPALPFEYLLLNMDFEAWTLEDCLAIISFQSWYSGALQNRDDFYYKLVETIGKERTEQLIIPYPDWAPTTVPPAMSQTSNAWVIAPERSSSGMAILASDPHLEVIRLPQFWYAVGIHSLENKLNVVGITTPGLPFIVYGHNDYAAWAFTAAGVDINDQYIERINPLNPIQYRTPEGWQDFDILSEIISIKDEQSRDTLTIKLSQHGPVISENDSLNEAYSLHWAGLDQSLEKAIESGFDLAKVKTFVDFRNCVIQFGALDANWLYADDHGNIGYQLGTPIPIRTVDQSYFKLPGWEKKYDWSGYWPLEKTPHAFNPQRGWLASCNNKPDQENIPYTLIGNFTDDRILRISELLQGKEKFSVPDMKSFQRDIKCNYLLRWKDEASRILNHLGKTELAQKIQNWKGQTDIKSREIAVLETWLYQLKKCIFMDDLGNITHEMRNKILLRDSQLEHVYFSNGNEWFDDLTTEKHIETRSEIATIAMKKALDEVKKRMWGELQTLTMAHPMAQVPFLSGILGLEKGPFPRGGTTGTLNVAFSMKNEMGGFDCIVAPSWRMIIDLANLDSMLISMPAGQSGHPLSKHFFDFYQHWDQVEYWTLPYSKESVYDRAVSVLSLEPIN